MDNLEQNTKGNSMTKEIKTAEDNTFCTEEEKNFINKIISKEDCLSTNADFLYFFEGYANTRFLRAFLLGEFIKLFQKNKGKTFKCTNKQIAQRFFYTKSQTGRIVRAKADLVKKGFISIERRYYITVNIETIYKELSKLNNKQS